MTLRGLPEKHFRGRVGPLDREPATAADDVHAPGRRLCAGLLVAAASRDGSARGCCDRSSTRGATNRLIGCPGVGETVPIVRQSQYWALKLSRRLSGASRVLLLGISNGGTLFSAALPSSARNGRRQV